MIPTEMNGIHGAVPVGGARTGLARLTHSLTAICNRGSATDFVGHPGGGGSIKVGGGECGE
jgi:hypothetical protein